MAIVVSLLLLLAFKNHTLNCSTNTGFVPIIILLVLEIAKYIFNNSCQKQNNLAFFLWISTFLTI